MIANYLLEIIADLSHVYFDLKHLSSRYNKYVLVVLFLSLYVEGIPHKYNKNSITDLDKYGALSAWCHKYSPRKSIDWQRFYRFKLSTSDIL